MSDKSVTLDIRLRFADNWQANTFLRLLRTMEFLDNIGHHGSMTLFCDGDGNFQFKAFLKTDGEYKDVHDLIPMTYEEWDKAVKAHKADQAERNINLRDNSELQFSMGD